jgi:glucokinase
VLCEIFHVHFLRIHGIRAVVMSDSNLAVGIDFGATTIKAGVVYKSHVIDHAPPVATKEFDSPESLIDAMARTVEELREKHPGVTALGVGLPGFVDFNKGWVHGLSNVPDWESIPLGRILEERTKLPTVIDNDANCTAIAEWRCGSARGLSNVVFVNIWTGVGGAVIANGQLIRGSRHVAGEMGRTSIDWQGRKTKFENPGALEEYLGSAGIAADARDGYLAAGIEKTLQECTVNELIAAAHRRDPVALARWNSMGKMLAAAVANACWLLNPEAVVIAGTVTRAGELLFKPLRDELFDRLSYPFKDHLMVLPAAFGVEACLIGAAALALEGSHLSV